MPCLVGTSYMMSSIASSKMARRPARAALADERLASDGLQRTLGELELDAVHLEHLLKLLHQAVLGLGKDVDQRVFGQLVERGDHRQAADELRNQAELQQVFGLYVSEQLAQLELLLALHVRTEASRDWPKRRCTILIEPDEGTTADEQDVAGVDL